MWQCWLYVAAVISAEVSMLTASPQSVLSVVPLCTSRGDSPAALRFDEQ